MIQYRTLPRKMKNGGQRKPFWMVVKKRISFTVEG
jgi:hypothetical protein